MTDEALLGPKLWKRLQIALQTRDSPKAIMKKALDVIEKVETTLLEKGFILDPAAGHALDGRGIIDSGLIHTVADSKGKDAFERVFDAEFWSRPQGSDLTLKDDLEILPLGLRELNFGRPTAKVAS